MYGWKAVSPDEMRRLEAGADCEVLMRRAGASAAAHARQLMEQRRLSSVDLLVYKGNKGGDAFAAGIDLLNGGSCVRALLFADEEECSPLCRGFARRFREAGGVIHPILSEEQISFGDGALLVDGLLGTGFTGVVSGLLGAAIRRANGSGLPILAIDLPSGVNGATGEVASVAIEADVTVGMGLPKIGCFLQNGWNFVGKLQIAEIGLPAGSANASAILLNPATLRLPSIVRNRHKYQAGCVVGFAGSCEYSGAAKLASLACLRGGAGLVRLFYPPSAQAEMADAPYEVIRASWEEAAWQEAMGRAKAVFAGPGLGRSGESRRVLSLLLSRLRVPVVLDADALLPDLDLPRGAICTPHRGEMARLLGSPELSEQQLLGACRRFASEKGVILVLKGAPTWVFFPDSDPYITTSGDPGMATAGSGDVLTGLLAALLAQGCTREEAALLGVHLHGLAGECAAREKTSYCLIAGDLIEAFPQAFQHLL